MKRLVKFVLVGDEGDIPEGMKDGDESIFEIDEGQPMLVGRVKHVDFFVNSPSVGRQVVAIENKEQNLWIKELGSGSGSFLIIDGKSIDRPDCNLPDRCKIRIGNVMFSVTVQ